MKMKMKMKMKKTKMVKKKEEEKKEYGLSELKRMGSELLSSKKHLNNLPILIGFLKPFSPPDYVLECLLSLQSFFTLIIPNLKKMKSNDESDGVVAAADAVYERWIGSKYEDFIKGLLELIVSENDDVDENVRQVVMDTIMEFVKIGGGGNGKFNSSLFHSFLNTLIFQSKPASNSSSSSSINIFASNYLQYVDVSYFTFISIHKIATTTATTLLHSASSSNELPIKNMLYILLRIPPPLNRDNDQLWTQNFLQSTNIAKKIKLKFTKAWISFLRLPLPLDVYKEVLVSLHQALIPYMSNPIMLCDFLTRSYDVGGVISVMALSGLYVLMTQHGLEYPNFYTKLYALLVPSVFIAKHRSKFFELLDSCLKSPLLPAYLAASFAKKLSRLSLSVPPSGGLVIVALIHNLLRRHPSINFLVHREDAQVTTSNVDELSEGGNKSSGTAGIDHFNNEETDPLKTNAMRSSLWEIDTLRHHYCPPLSRFVLSLENDLTVRSKTTEVAVKDFSGGSYATIFGEEIRRRVKQVPLAFYKATPTCLFSEADFPGWSFKHEEDGNVAAKRQRIECD